MMEEWNRTPLAFEATMENGKMEGWKNGRIRRFDNSTMEEWKNLTIENSTIRQWKSGKMEGWKDFTTEARRT